MQTTKKLRHFFITVLCKPRHINGTRQLRHTVERAREENQRKIEMERKLKLMKIEERQRKIDKLKQEKIEKQKNQKLAVQSIFMNME